MQTRILALVLTVLPLLGPLATTASTQQDRPNFVVILADDQGWGTTSIDDYDPEHPRSQSDFFETPHLERLAEQGRRFTQAYAPHPNCSPTRAAIQTGRSPAALHYTDITFRNSGPLYEGRKVIPPRHINGLPRNEKTIAELLKAHDSAYRAAHFGKWHMANGGPSAHGYDEGSGATTNREGSRSTNLPDDPKRAYSITRKAGDWMSRQVENGNPFYLQISHYATHLKYQSRPKTREKFESKPRGDRHNNVRYGAMLHDLDNNVGRVLDRIRKLGIEDDTYIIYTADNGTYPTRDPGNINGPVRGFKASVWEGGVRVPFIAVGPGIPAGTVSREPVTGCDILPTVLDIAGRDPGKLPDVVEGGSLAPVLKSDSEQIEVERRFDGLHFHWPHYQLSKRSRPGSTVVKDGWKLHYWWETVETSLYHLKTDVGESNDLSEERPIVERRLRLHLLRYLDAVDAQLPRGNPDWGARLNALDKPVRQHLLFDLDPADAIYADIGENGHASVMNAYHDRGFALQVSFRPAPKDVAGGALVPLIEVGGSSNGSGLYLVNGVPTLAGKQNTGPTATPDSLQDTDLSGNGTFVVQHSAGRLDPDTSYRVAARYQPPASAGEPARVRFSVARDQEPAVTEQLLIHGARRDGDWSGNDSVSIGRPSSRNQHHSGGLHRGDASAGPAMLHTKNLKPVDGRMGRSFYWNQTR